ncbi:unnamed protein product [Rotaria sordida]|uniref:Integrase catalytic domain-containing protein n=1 Tax=Rotaria sordida TaxID=392033 RepID=A0A816CS45_9BILA|nr:unnamed protein product [Rotaria sordida]CAF1628929.1 unnamed protein product [Rotaria sordida]
MQKSESLGSLNLPTNSENLILTSTFNPASKPSSFSKMTRRMDIIPTPNRPDKLLPSTKTQSCSNEDSSVMNTVIATESNTAFEDDHVLCDNRQDTSVIPNLIHNQSHQKDHTSDEQEDDNLFDTFICENFVPFSGAEPINQWLDETDALFHRFKISRKLRFQAIPLLVQGDAKRKYIKNRHAIKSFDDFYEFLLTHFDSTPVTVSTSKPSQTNHKVEFAKDSMCISNITTDSKLNVANITDATQLSQPSVSSYSKLAIDDTTTTSGDVSDSNLSGNTSTINRLPSDPVITDLRKAIVADFIRNPKIFRGNKDDVTKCTNSNYRSIPRTSFRAYQGSSNYTSDPNYVSKQNRTQASNSNYYYQSPRHSLSTNKYNDNTGSRKQKNIQPHKSFAQPDNKATSRSVNAVFTSTLPPNHDDNLDSLSTVVCHLYDLPVVLTTDASDIGIGGVLQQEVNGQLRNLYYHSQVITPCQRKYKQFDDIFDIEYGLASKSRSILSSATSDNDTKNLTSDSTVSSTNPNVLAAMTLRPPLYLPSSMINSLLKACHDDPLTGAHFSTDRMYYKIRPHFWWPDRAKRYGHLRSIPPPEGPFALIGIDFCGPLPRTPSENQYVLIITDYFTRHITALALPNCTAETAARALFDDCFCKFGIPSVILSDRGTHFQNKLMENLQHLIGYNHIYSTPYHPQTNGIVERFNATFVTQISKLQNAQHNNWDEYLQAVVFAYNTGVHKSTKFSPYELLYGRTARLPIHIQPTEFTFPKPNDYFEQLKKTLRIFHQASRENILFQQQANQAYYNKNRLDPQLKLGDKVLTRVHVSKGKLDPKFSPIPKIVVEIHHPMYVVEDECTHIRSQVHISDLRPISFE